MAQTDESGETALRHVHEVPAEPVTSSRSRGAPEKPELDETRYLEFVAANVRGARRSRGMTQLDLALRAGVDLRFVQRVEGAKTNLSVAFLVKFARALDMAPHQLLQEAAFVPPPAGRPRRNGPTRSESGEPER